MAARYPPLRIFLYTLAGIAFLVIDGILVYNLPGPAARLTSVEESWLVLGGTAAYLLVHFLVRKPERMYLWAHEFAHLIVAKLFFRRIHQFHISSRDGGKVVMDGTNVLIDLAPYLLPLYSIAAFGAAALFRKTSPWVPDVYLALASFLFAMHVLFSAAGFLAGQPDLKRSGRVFSAGLVILVLLLWVPCLMAPGVAAGWKGVGAAYGSWFARADATARLLIRRAVSLF